MHGLVARMLAVLLGIGAAAAGPAVGPARADRVLVYPGMEIRQDSHVCTLGYVDPVLRVAFSAGHCRGSGHITDRGGTVIGTLATFRDNTPNGSTVNTDQVIDDYEAIVLVDDVDVNDFLPGGVQLQGGADSLVNPGDPVCHFGIATGETCGTVERVNNGWFTMSRGVRSQQGDSGGPVYVMHDSGTARLVGLFNSVWGEFPAAVSWPAIAQQVRDDVGVPAPQP
ncbi:hypothetical protein MHIB_13880 [Mycolicibacter hiberniae]|uniref:Trypsin n=2 Tax=Mycolicibacter hiberniae TaxID=29314 RepID=A0A7I7X110_9MYCO|nr:hypothetical protein MHIB_13880 [Mycolicibacter hiberniae]